MTRPSTRERRERFIKSFDRFPGSTLDDAISKCLSRHGWSWLTDEQLAEIASDVADDAMAANRRMVRNRQIIRSAA